MAGMDTAIDDGDTSIAAGVFVEEHAW